MGKIIELGDRLKRKTSRSNHPTNCVNDSVPTIGSCAFCNKRSQLQNELCGTCRRKAGDDMGHAMRRVRQNPAFAKACYVSLDKFEEKAKFIQIFGLPPGCFEPGLKIADNTPSLSCLVNEYNSIIDSKK